MAKNALATTRQTGTTIQEVLGSAVKRNTRLGLSDAELLEVYRMASFGMAPGQIMAKLGRNPSAAGIMMSKSVEFKLAFDKGCAAGIDDVATQLYQKAMDGNVVAMIFFMKNVAKWSDNQAPQPAAQVTNNHVNIVTPEILPPDKWTEWVSQQSQMREKDRQEKIDEMEAADVKLIETLSESEIGAFSKMIDDGEE